MKEKEKEKKEEKLWKIKIKANSSTHNPISRKPSSKILV